jgi:hypothetical protein
MRGSGVTRLLVTFAFLGSFESSAVADEPASVGHDSEGVPPSVTITTVGDVAEASALEARVVSWFHDQGTRTETNRQAAVDPRAFFSNTHESGMRIWIMLELPASVRLFFAVQEPRGVEPRYLTRQVALEHGLDELGLEQVAQVVDLSATAVWVGNVQSSRQEVEKGLGVAPVPEPAREEAVVHPDSLAPVATKGPAPADRTSVVAGIEYTARMAGPEGILHGPGANIALLPMHRPLELGARMHAQILLPREVTRSGVTLGLHGAAFALGGSMARSMSERLSATGEVGMALDLIEYEPVARDASLKPSDSATELRPFVYASVGVQTELGSVTLGAAMLVAVQLLSTHYDIAEHDQRVELLRPWLVQPGLAGNVSW